jgi:hypothetical protein
MNEIILVHGPNLIPGRFRLESVEMLNGTLVRLVGAIEHLPPPTTLVSGRQQDTKLEIRMDQAAAILLAAKIHELSQTMDWLQRPANGNQA